MPSRLYAFDFDRTLGRTKRIAEAFVEHVRDEDPKAADVLRVSQAQVEASGGSFDMLRVLREHMGLRALDNCVEGFVGHRQQESFLEEGAQSLLQGAIEGGHRVGIMTYGGPEWQTIKLRATDLDRVPHMILAEKGIKGAMIASWYDDTTGLYRVPDELGGGVVEEVVFADDKQEEFKGLPRQSSVRGYWFTGSDIKPVAETSTDRPGEALPPNVVRVSSLHDIAQREGLKT